MERRPASTYVPSRATQVFQSHSPPANHLDKNSAIFMTTWGLAPGLFKDEGQGEDAEGNAMAAAGGRPDGHRFSGPYQFHGHLAEVEMGAESPTAAVYGEDRPSCLGVS